MVVALSGTFSMREYFPGVTLPLDTRLDSAAAAIGSLSL